MGDWGAKVSIKGIPVETAADHQLLFNSSWPLLKIHKQGSATITDTTKDVVITTHDLGYEPMFLVYAPSGVNATSSQSRLITVPALINDTDLMWFGDYYSEPAGSIDVYYYIFRYDMTTNFTSGTVGITSATANVADDYGFKISKEGKDTSSTDGKDFVIHSSYRSPQIHKTFYKNQTSEGWSEEILHGLTYEPYFLFYTKNNYAGLATTGYWGLIDSRAQEQYGYIGESAVRVGAIPKGEMFVCIFKDPFSLEE